MALRKIVTIDEDLCDGCGDCVPSCAEGAIRIVDGKARLVGEALCDGLGACLGECPRGAIAIEEREAAAFDEAAATVHLAGRPQAPREAGRPGGASQLRQWPVQLHLISPQAPCFQGADVLLAADCCAFAVGDFHERFLKGKALAVACPKLDHGQDAYLAKLTAMIDLAAIDTLTVLMMQVPCCSGLLRLAQQAVQNAGRKVPIKQIVVGMRGEVLKEEWC